MTIKIVMLFNNLLKITFYLKDPFSGEMSKDDQHHHHSSLCRLTGINLSQLSEVQSRK